MAGLKRRLDRLETQFSDIALMRRGDLAAARRLLERDTQAFIDDLHSAPQLYGAEVERVIACAADSVAAQYRAAWALIPAYFYAEHAGDTVRTAEIAAQIEIDFDALPELNGGRMWMLLDSFYHASRPGFKLADDDLRKVGDLLFTE